MPLSDVGTRRLPWGEARMLVLGILRRTDSMLYADLSNAKYALSIADVHLIHLAVGWFNGHREKGSKPIESPRLYEDTNRVTVTDEDREVAARMLAAWGD